VFQQLIPLLNNATLVLTISGSAEALTLNVIPQPIDANADGGLKTPLSITGTAAELDAGFSDALTSYTASYLSMAESIANAQAQMAEAEKEIKSANVGAFEHRTEGAKTNEQPHDHRLCRRKRRCHLTHNFAELEP